jgi:NAD-dependent SIR2 family protein deacetylase
VKCIFLGAGASAADGAPVQGQLFSEYFKFIRGHRSHLSDSERDVEQELRSFFKEMFDVDVDYARLGKVGFPTFEEVLGLVDLAEKRGESFRKFDLESLDANSSRLRLVRLYLVLAMAQIIEEKLKNAGKHHNMLVNQLAKRDRLPNTIFFSTNYDVLIDNALLKVTGHVPNYGVDFKDLNQTHVRRDAPRLFKVHGSLNWLYCRVCNDLTLTPDEKGVIRLLKDSREAKCSNCGSLYAPLIVPPTFFKDFSNPFLGIIWNKVENVLREVDQVVFCGYSFPDADMHIKYLLKRADKNGQADIQFTVINNPGHHVTKKAEALEQARFSRFLGKRVNYTESSFEEFARYPTKFLC